MSQFKARLLLGCLLVLTSTCMKVSPTSDVPSHLSDTMTLDGPARLKLVWISLDGFQAATIEPWLMQIKNPHPKGLTWLIKETHGRPDLKVINPTITAPSHVSTITCTGAGVHEILDNYMWTGRGFTSGFNKIYNPENWMARLKKSNLRVGSSLYPSFDGATPDRTPDVGMAYDNPTTPPQLISVAKGQSIHASVADRYSAGKAYSVAITYSQDGTLEVTTPWSESKKIAEAQPVDFYFDTTVQGVKRHAGVSVMAVAIGSDHAMVEVSPEELMPVFNNDFAAVIDSQNILFSGLRDYRVQSITAAYLATMDHRRHFIAAADLALLARNDLDVAFLYFEDLDALLHAYYHDDVNEAAVVEYLSRFDQDLGRVLSAIPSTSDLVVLGDHGMSAIGYVLNARKILTEDVASLGTVTTGGGAIYLYPPSGDLQAEPPSNLDLNAVAERLRSMDSELTSSKLFGKVIVRGSKEAAEEGLTGKNVPWIMAFANEGVAFKNSVENRWLLARAPWAKVPDVLRTKYADPLEKGKLVVPVPAGQHGHWNETPQMRTHLVLEGPKLSKIDPTAIEKTLQLVPAVADALGWPRPSGCAK